MAEMKSIAVEEGIASSISQGLTLRAAAARGDMGIDCERDTTVWLPAEAVSSRMGSLRISHSALLHRATIVSVGGL